ncbi:MAG: flagellin, partial [Pseudomonadota bacterium]
MSLVINHNMMAMTAARNLSDSYGRLATSTQRLSSGMRINSAADDAAGLAVRELMRSDISTINQGLRNAGDAISMIQTADGAMSVIDEKLIRMKELAEQAATGTYTTAQRTIMDSEYQAMAAEIDRIANATDFNGVKLLDGSLTNLHNGSGMKIHFGTGNSAAEDYYYVSMGDMRATQASGLRVGTSDTNDIFRTTAFSAATPTTALGGTTGVFGVEYTTDNGTTWNTYGYVNVTAGTDTLTTVMDNINGGAAEKGTFTFGTALTSHMEGTVTIGSYVFTFSSTTASTATTFNSTL